MADDSFEHGHPLGLKDEQSDRFEMQLAQKTAESRYLQRMVQEQEKRLQLLTRQTEWSKQAQAVLLKLNQILQQQDTLATILNLVGSEIQAFFHSDRVCVFEYNLLDKSGLVISEVVKPPFPNTLGYIIQDEIIAGVKWLRCYQNGEVCSLSDLEACQSNHTACYQFLINKENALPPECDRSFDLWQFFQVKSKLAVPIFRDQKIWGLLAIHQCEYKREWQDFEVQTLQVIATQVGSFLTQLELQQRVSYLETDIQKQHQEHKSCLANTIDFEAMLKRITVRVRDSLDETQILQTAMQELVAVLNVQQMQSVACVASLDGTCGKVQAYELEGDDPSYTALDHYDFTELCEQLRQGKIMQFCPMLPWLNRSDQMVLICPVLDSQGCLGNLQFYRSRHQIFTDQELQLIQQVASHCAIAIRQARLYQASCIHVQELEQLSRLKDDFLSTVSHELRTPLSSIKMVTSLLKLAMHPSITQTEDHNLSDLQKQKIGQYLKVLEDECEREISLINDLLATQHLDTGKHPLNPTTINLQEWLPQMLRIFQHRTQMNQQHLTIHLPSSLPPIMSDMFMLSRVMVELLNNACKYTPPDGQIYLRAVAKAATIEFTVENTGVQIPPEQISRIFDPFYRVPADDRWKRGGTGLGLFLIKRFVEYLGGTIQAQNLLDSVQFSVTLPLTVETL